MIPTNDAPPRMSALPNAIVRHDDAMQRRCAFQDFGAAAVPSNYHIPSDGPRPADRESAGLKRNRTIGRRR